MAEIVDDAAVLDRGKALAARDGFTWEIDFSATRGSFRGLRFLSEERRREYLEKARAEMQSRGGGA